MDIKSLVPWRRERNDVAIRRESGDPFYSLQREINRIFDDFFSGFEMMPFGASTWGGFNPRVDMAETDKAYTITAELPGMDEKDIDVALTPNSLTIKGEKKAEKEEKGQDYYRTERSYGSFTRTIPLPADVVDSDKVDASFNKGVLTINLPKSEQAQRVAKRITVKAA